MALNERDYRKGTRSRIKGPGTTTSDSVPAMLSKGEFVVKASSAAKIGEKALNHMNRTGRIPMKMLKLRGKRRVKMQWGGFLGKLGAGAAALYGAKKGVDYMREPTPTTTPEITPGAAAPDVAAPGAAPNPNYGGVATPLNQGATNALEERIRRAGGAKGGYAIRRKKMNLGGMAKAAGWLTTAAATAYAGKKGIDAAERIKKEREEKMKEVEAATPKKKYGGGYAWPRKQMMRGGKVMSVKPGRGVISTTGRGPEDDRLDGFNTYGYAHGGKAMGLRAAYKGGGHPGFKAVQAKIARKSGVPMKNAGAILAAASRRASPAAKRANPRLNRVKG